MCHWQRNMLSRCVWFDAWLILSLNSVGVAARVWDLECRLRVNIPDSLLKMGIESNPASRLVIGLAIA